MNKEELIGQLQMVYVGDKNALNELIGYYDGLKEVVELLKKENQKYKEVIDKAIDFIENGDLLYLATKNSIVHRNNIEIRAVADRLNDLLQILEDKEVSE